MRLYFEAYKEQSEEEIERGIPQPMLRIEIKSEEEAYELKEKFKDQFDKFYIHYCYNDEIPPKPCKLKEI